MYARHNRARVGLPLSMALLLPTGNVEELEEFVVTAQRRAEELQSVPLAVTAFSAETRARLSVNGPPAITLVNIGMPRQVGLDFQYRF